MLTWWYFVAVLHDACKIGYSRFCTQNRIKIVLTFASVNRQQGAVGGGRSPSSCPSDGCGRAFHAAASSEAEGRTVSWVSCNPQSPRASWVSERWAATRSCSSRLPWQRRRRTHAIRFGATTLRAPCRCRARNWAAAPSPSPPRGTSSCKCRRTCPELFALCPLEGRLSPCFCGWATDSAREKPLRRRSATC